MSCQSLGIHLRWLCLLLFLLKQTYFILHGISLLQNQEGEMGGIYIYNNNNNNNNNNNEISMTQCNGVNDYTTCTTGTNCIQSSCGRPLFPNIGVSYAGSYDAFDPTAGSSTTSIVTIASLFYSIVPYLMGVAFVIHFLACGSVVPLTRLGLVLFIALVNDAVLKNFIRQPRPGGSCLYFHAYGMPR